MLGLICLPESCITKNSHTIYNQHTPHGKIKHSSVLNLPNIYKSCMWSSVDWPHLTSYPKQSRWRDIVKLLTERMGQGDSPWQSRVNLVISNCWVHSKPQFSNYSTQQFISPWQQGGDSKSLIHRKDRDSLRQQTLHTHTHLIALSTTHKTHTIHYH